MGCGSSTANASPSLDGFDKVTLHNHEGPSPPPSAPPEASISFASNLGMYGKNKFKGKIAGQYLAKQGLGVGILDTNWTRDDAVSKKVAAAVVEWAKAQGTLPITCRFFSLLIVLTAPTTCPCASAGATMSTHVFQPLGSGIMRVGQTGQVHNAMFNFKKDGQLGWVFDEDTLRNGETDGSSYQNGGMRATHTAGAYTALDPSCPIFIRGDTVHIPTVRAAPLEKNRRLHLCFGNSLRSVFWRVHGRASWRRPSATCSAWHLAVARAASYRTSPLLAACSRGHCLRSLSHGRVRPSTRRRRCSSR